MSKLSPQGVPIIRERKVCKECGSENVRLLAWLEWGFGRWRLSMDGGEEDRFWCIDCDADIEIVTKYLERDLRKEGGNDYE
jgi:hypothetical protein